MAHQDLIEALEKYKLNHPTEISLSDQIISFIRETPGCFDRHQKEGHITGSAWVVNDDQQILLTHHKKLDIWIQLGGHADGETDVKKVALKEAEEESGLDNLMMLSEEVFDVDIHLIPANAKENEHYHFDIRYLITAGETNQFKMSEESMNMSWIDVDDIEKYTIENSILKMKRKYIAYLNALKSK